MDRDGVESVFSEICDRGFATCRRVLPKSVVTMARRRLHSEAPTDASVVYMALDPKDELIAFCVERIFPLAELAFGDRTQLLRAQLTETPPGPIKPERSWHRDLPVESLSPLTITAIFYLDAVSDVGNTFVLPAGSLSPALLDLRDDREIAIDAHSGDCLLLNGSVWHSGSAPSAGTRRRALILQFGYWWIKQHSDQHETGSINEVIYGRKAPPGDLFITDR